MSRGRRGRGQGRGNGDEPLAVYTAATDRREHRKRRRRRRSSNAPVILLVIASLALLGLIAFAVAKASEGGDPAHKAGVVQVAVGKRVLARGQAARLARLPTGALQRWLARLPAQRRERRGAAVVTLQTDRVALRRLVRRAARRGGGTVKLPGRPIASAARLPAIKQALRNNCETAALSMLLRARRVRVDQVKLQRQLPRSGPLDPRGGIWGDPQQGFVGRVEGGGPAGGYGVYQRPIKRLAKRRGVRLVDMSGPAATAIYRRLLSGRPLMVWVGLADGPYETWRTPAGKRITGNLNEHAVVLTGMSSSGLAVNDPLTGQREQWSRAQFELMWQRLGRRALGT